MSENSNTSINTHPLSFEEAMKRLENLVSGFEKGKFSLEEAMNAYQEAQALQKICQEKLDTYALQIQRCDENQLSDGA